MKLSVVVASSQGRELLDECVDAILPQCRSFDAEVIVARPMSATTPGRSGTLAAGIRLVPCSGGASIPEIRGMGLAAAGGDWVVLTEDTCVARPDWLGRLVAAFGTDVDVLGGVIGTARRTRPVDAGATFAEYGFYGPMRSAGRTGSAPPVTCANAAYRREPAASIADWSLAGAWDNVVHDRLAAGGARFGLVADAVVDDNREQRFGSFLRERFWHGRDYAVTRRATLGIAHRAGLALGAPLLPLVLSWRAWRSSGRAATATFARALPFTVAFFAAWAAGEAAGYFDRGRAT